MPHRAALAPRICLLAVLVMTVAVLAAASPATAQTAPAETATVHPGVMTFTEGGQCTANFVFASGADLFIGQAAHCAGTGGATSTNGCDAGSLPLDTDVEISGADHPGKLAYSSWLTMQAAGEEDFNTCQYNDFALVRIDPRDHDKVNPSIPFYGGPVGLETAGTDTLEQVYSYGNSSLRAGVELLSPKSGLSLGTTAEGWNHPVYTVSPGIPGDSGSAFLDADGNALGSLSTLAIAPLAGSNGVTDLNLALEYANNEGGGAFTLVNGTEPFSPSLVPLGLGLGGLR